MSSSRSRSFARRASVSSSDSVPPHLRSAPRRPQEGRARLRCQASPTMAPQVGTMLPQRGTRRRHQTPQTMGPERLRGWCPRSPLPPWRGSRTSPRTSPGGGSAAWVPGQLALASTHQRLCTASLPPSSLAAHESDLLRRYHRRWPCEPVVLGPRRRNRRPQVQLCTQVL